jgi:hypothetical protein
MVLLRRLPVAVWDCQKVSVAERLWPRSSVLLKLTESVGEIVTPSDKVLELLRSSESENDDDIDTGDESVELLENVSVKVFVFPDRDEVMDSASESVKVLEVESEAEMKPVGESSVTVC